MKTMTREQAQAAYDAAGTCEAFAAAHGMSRSRAHVLLKRLGVKLNQRGGWLGNQYVDAAVDARRPTVERKADKCLSPGRVTVVNCPHGVTTRTLSGKVVVRPCVVHDLPGSCEKCAHPYERAGVCSLFAAAEVVR